MLMKNKKIVFGTGAVMITPFLLSSCSMNTLSLKEYSVAVAISIFVAPPILATLFPIKNENILDVYKEKNSGDLSEDEVDFFFVDCDPYAGEEINILKKNKEFTKTSHYHS